MLKVYIYIQICIYVCMYIYIYIYMCMYIHIHMHKLWYYIIYIYILLYIIYTWYILHTHRKIRTDLARRLVVSPGKLRHCERRRTWRDMAGPAGREPAGGEGCLNIWWFPWPSSHQCSEGEQWGRYKLSTYIYIYGGFHKWWYRQVDGLSWKILLK